MKIKYFYPLIWFCLIVLASLTPSSRLPHINLFPQADKVIHFCMYLGFYFLLIPPFTFKKNYKRSYFFSFIISVFIGLLMEYLQYLLAMGRSAEFFDVVADTIGVIAGISIYQLIIRNKRWEKKIFRIE